jgi:hypothetical protein
MKTLCITGYSITETSSIAGILNQAGMANAIAAPKETPVDLAIWHERILKAYAEQISQNGGSFAPGRLWEQLAGDIFLANMDQTCWGWADPRAIKLLDFWQQFEPGIRFILVSISPEQALARAIENPADQRSSQNVLDEWQATHQAMLRFHLRHPEHSLLISAESVQAAPASFVQFASQRWSLPLEAPQQTSEFTPTNPLALLLARQITEQYPETAALHDEILASLSPAQAPAEATFELGGFEHQPHIDALRALLEDQKYKASHAELNIQYKESQKEGELLLQQLHQVQKELESLFLKHADQEKQTQTAQARIKELGATQEKEQQATKQLQQQLEKVAKDADQQAKSLQQANQEKASLAQQHEALKLAHKESQEEGELLLLQLHQVQEELESLFLKHADQEKQTQTAQARTKELLGAREKDQQSAAQLQQQLQQSKQEKENLATQVQKLKQAHQTSQEEHQNLQRRHSELENQLSDTREENDLILLQLHRVQEELEHYFLQHQETTNQLELAEARWQRMLARHPDFIDYHSISASQDDNKTHWEITQLDAAGRSFDSISFSTFVDKGAAAIEFNRQPGETGPLRRWPASASQENTLILLPAGSGKALQQRMRQLQELSVSDWNLVNTLLHILQEAIAQPATLQGKPGDLPALAAAIAQTQERLKDIPSVPRFDNVTLKREQLNPDYEHLWLEIDNLELGPTRLPRFEYRVSCANVGPQRFGTHPKFEFPESTQTAFENWFAESQDDFGEKLELRFAKPLAMDMNIWNQLSHSDKTLVATILALTPVFLSQIAPQRDASKRPVEAWQKLATDSLGILRQVTGNQR